MLPPRSCTHWRGRCVQFSTQDLAPNVVDKTVAHIAVILNSEEAALNTACAIAASPMFNRRSPCIFPVLEVTAPFLPQFKLQLFPTADEATSFPPDAPTFSLIAVVSEVKLETISFPEPFQAAIQLNSVVRLSTPNRFAVELTVALEDRFSTEVRVLGKRRARNLLSFQIRCSPPFEAFCPFAVLFAKCYL